jgi:hypothetical protein
MNRLQKFIWIVPALALLTVTSSWTASDDDQQPGSTNDKQINCLRARRAAPPATSRPSTLNPAGICNRPARSASTTSKQIRFHFDIKN